MNYLFTKLCPECFNIIGHPELLVFGGKVKILGFKSGALSGFLHSAPLFSPFAAAANLILSPIPRHRCKSLGSPPLQISRLATAAKPNHARGHAVAGSTVVSPPLQIVRFVASSQSRAPYKFDQQSVAWPPAYPTFGEAANP